MKNKSHPQKNKLNLKSLKKQIKKIKIKHVAVTITAIILLTLLVGIFHSYKPLPEGISYTGNVINISEGEIEFLYDLTYEVDEKRVYNHEIFDTIFETIDEAEKYILIDMFLWSTTEESYRDLGQEMTDHLINRKKEIPDLEIIIITDDYNTGYNSFNVSYFDQMNKAGIDVVFTDLTKLRDSNILYSPIWRTFFQVFGEPKKGWVKIPGLSENGSIRAFLKILNFKANHRKTMIADCGKEMCSFVISANPSGSGSKHSNVGFKIKGDIYKDLYNSEKAVLEMSDYKLDEWDFDFVKENEIDIGENKDIEVQLLTEKKIKDAIIEGIEKSEEDEEIKIAMFYFSDRDIVDALLKASEKGVNIEIIADPSKTGFGRDKFGVPTRMVADELIKKSNGKIKIRYYDTDEEQFHTKMIVFIKKDKIIVILGSGNYTKRNINDLNLESDVKVTIPIKYNISTEILNYFKKMWNNENGHYTVDSNYFEEPSIWRQIQYRVQEATGASTF